MKIHKAQFYTVFVLIMAGLVPQAVGAESAAPIKPAAAKTIATRPLTLAENAPDSYTVVKGDTLWGISGKFLKEPWRWPEIWNMNRDEVKNPHWIYPGDVIRLDFDGSGQPRLSLTAGNIIKLSPHIRVDRFSQAIPSIPARVIAPFLSLPLVIEINGLQNAPRIVATEEGRVIVGAGNGAYVVGMNESLGAKWQIYRPGAALTDPDTKEILGYEAKYLGDAHVSKFGETSTIDILRSTQEINRGDRLTPTVESAAPSYSPHAPDKPIGGSVIAINGGVTESAQYSVVALNRGKRDGLEVGHVLATFQKGEWASTKTEDSSAAFRWNTDSSPPHNPTVDNNAQVPPSGTASSQAATHAEISIPSQVKLPDERNGLIFVFRVFDKVAYALVMQSRRSLRIGDRVANP